MNRELRLFQEKGAQFVAEKLRAALLVDMGLGKTPISSKAIALKNCRRLLIVCPDNAIEVWENDGKAWLEQFTGVPTIVHTLNDEPWNRELVWNQQTEKSELHVYVVVYNTFARDMGTQAVKKKGQTKKQSTNPSRTLRSPQGFDAVIVDEARRIRSRKALAFKALKELFQYYHIPIFIPMTGTLGNSPEHFWTIFHLFDPKKYGSYWKWVEQWCEVEVNFFGGREIVGPLQPAMPKFHDLLRQHIYLVRENDPGIADQRPPITRQRLTINMDPEQERHYKNMKKELITFCERSDDYAVAQNSLALSTRFRQLLICPQILLPNSTVGAALPDLIGRIKEEEVKLPTVIFTPYTKAFDPFTRYLGQHFDPQNIFTLSSGDVPSKKIEPWRDKQGIMICSILYAQAFSLEPATKGFFIGYDWDPDNNRQAEKRLHRLTTLNPINIYYYVHRKTYELKVADVVNEKFERLNITLPANFRNLLAGDDNE